MINNPSRKTPVLAIAFALAILTFIVYLPALNNGFVNWDDNVYVYENPNIRTLDIDFLKWSLTSVVAGLWHPLTLLSLATDYALWGLNPEGYHLTNILFHALNAMLVFYLTMKLLSFRYQRNMLFAAIVTTLLFGLHPLRVESVVWVSERKDVLCTFFFLLSLLAYLRYNTGRSKKTAHYITCVIFYLMALMSKPMAISLPIVLLILDFYPLRRLTNVKRIFLEKLPFFILSATVAAITVWAHSSSDSLKAVESLPFLERFFLAIRGYFDYLFNMAMPFKLSPIYPYPKEINKFELEYIGPFILFSLITLFCLMPLKRERKREKAFLAVWLYYLFTLLPVIGLVPVGRAALADRYTYLPSFGVFMLAGVAMKLLFDKYPYKTMIIIALLMVIFVFKTERQISIWKDSITLWSHEIHSFPYHDTAYTNRGLAYTEKGQYSKAIEDLDKAIELNPKTASAYNNRGIAYAKISQYDKAIEDFNKAVELNPDANIYNNRANVYNNKGQYDWAIWDYTKAVSLEPNYKDAYFSRGNAYANKGQYDRAISDYRKACEMGDTEGCKAFKRLLAKWN